MDDGSRRPQHGEARLALRVLDGPHPAIYVALSTYPLIVIAIAWYSVGASASLVYGPNLNGAFEGYFVRENWMMYPIALPLAFAILVFAWRHLARGAPEDERGEEAEQEPPWPPIVRIMEVTDDRMRWLWRSRLREWIAAPKAIAAVAAAAFVLTALDTREVVAAYASCLSPDRAACTIAERDWTVMALGTRADGSRLISPACNIAFNAAAYVQQLVITVFGLALLTVFFRHNWFFLRSIYVRHRRRPDKPPIRIRLDTGEGRFGFEDAARAFNLQVGLAAVAGLLVVMSRWNNVTVDIAKTLADLNAPDVPQTIAAILDSAHFPDTGQWILFVSWCALIGTISMPSLVKFLPFRYARCRSHVSEYLRCLIPDGPWPDRWSFGEKPDSRALETVSSKFRDNAFWPTGDGAAYWLFLIAFWVNFNVLFPAFSFDAIPASLALQLSFVAGAALLSKAMLALYGTALRYVGDALVKSRYG